jgi:hypothetical protein
MIDKQTELEAINSINAICIQHFKSFEIAVIERKPNTPTTYFAHIGVLVREGEISQAFLHQLFLELFQAKDCLFDFMETKRDIRDLSFEEVYIRAKISV